jgi:hypothetical protein
MSADALAGFRHVVLGDTDLQRELLAAGERRRFVALVVERARGRGWDVGADDVEEGLRESRRAWLERWI